MKNNGFCLFQTVLALLITSTSLMFVFELTIQHVHSTNEIVQSIRDLNQQINNFEILLADKT